MKKNLYYLLPVMLCFATTLWGQQMPWFSAYSFQPKYFNPAAQGGATGGSVGVAYRSQFADLPTESRPVTYMVHADVSPLIGERIGLGLVVMQDEVHLNKRTQATGFFGYHLFPKENNFHLSLGVMAGILNQSFDLATATVNDPNDLILMQATEAKMQFDGGLGVQARFAGVQLDVAIPQLFTSDFEFEPGGTDRMVRYDVFPHLLTSLRYSWQGNGFALEPNVAYREAFGKTLKAGLFDFGVRGYFLDHDMLMVGFAYRTDEGGMLFSAGVKPVRQLFVFGAYETHAMLGNTFEAGIQYSFGADDQQTVAGKKGKYDKTAEARLAQLKTSTDASQKKMSDKMTVARENVELARYMLNDAKTAPDFNTQQDKLVRADKYISETEKLLKETETEFKNVDKFKTDADALMNQVTANGQKIHNTNDLESIRATYSLAMKQANELTGKYQDLTNQRLAVVPMLNVNDPVSIKNSLTNDLAMLAGKPDESIVVQVTSTTIEIRFADAEEVYAVGAGSGKVKTMADWLAGRIDVLKKEGLKIESARLYADLLYADTRVDARYAGEYGATFKTPYKLNGKAITSNLKKDATLTLETLGVLKLHDLRRYMVSKTGMPEASISIELNAPNPGNEYQQMTKVVLNYRK